MLYLRLSLLCLLCYAFPTHATQDNIQRAVWVNEAIIATFTYDHEHFLAQQKEIAAYFTAKGWISYSDAQIAAKLPETIKKNAYYVRAVATLPPTVKAINTNEWQAIMPILVIYKNPQYQQKQSLRITLTFIKAPEGTGVRGLAITSLKASITEPACRCVKEGKTKAMA